MRGQALVGIFLMLIGILIFVYWILLPATEKQKLLEELYNETRYEEATPGPTFEISNIQLSKDAINLIIAKDYTIGDFIRYKELKFKDIYLSTNIFVGEARYSFTFPFEEGDGIFLNFTTECNNCKLKIILNDNIIFEGTPPKNFSKFIRKADLNEDNTIKFVLEPSANPFVSSDIKIKNIKIIYVKRRILSFEFFYNGGDIYLKYDFCPADPSLISVKINNKEVLLPTCSSYLYNTNFDLRPYVSQGRNIITVMSLEPIKISLELELENKYFYTLFEKPKDDIIYLFVTKGFGKLHINNCTFYINPKVSTINIKNCTESLNSLVIEAYPYVSIEKLVIV